MVTVWEGYSFLARLNSMRGVQFKFRGNTLSYSTVLYLLLCLGAAGKWPEMNIVGKLLQDPINFPAVNYFYFLKIKNISRP